MTRRPALLLSLAPIAVLAWAGCDNPPPDQQAAADEVVPQLLVRKTDDGNYELRCTLRSSPQTRDPVSLHQTLVLAPGKRGQISVGSGRFLRLLLEARVDPGAQPDQANVTYLLLLATQHGMRPWQGQNVAWTLGEARALADDPDASPAPAPTPAAEPTPTPEPRKGLFGL